jgi:hypothetical protein
MADVNRSSSDSDIMIRKPELYLQHLEIILNEKLNQIKALDVHLDQLRTVEMKRIELKKATLEEEIKALKAEIGRKTVIEIKLNEEIGD